MNTAAIRSDDLRSNQLDTPAFRAAMLRSERRRAYVVLGVAALVVGLALVPNLGGSLHPELIVSGVCSLAILMSLQLTVLACIRRSARLGQVLPLWLTLCMVVIESAIPSGIILWNLLRGNFPPYSVLQAPPLLAYGLMIGLTTLRLSPALCLLAGVLSSGGYFGILIYVTHGLGLKTPTTGLPYAAYMNTGMMILISGIAAAWMAGEIRRYVRAALSEAEVRHQLERVEQDFAVARSIQRALLPKHPPRISGYDIAGWNRSADDTGGDYFDWQRLADGRWIVSLADVSGHGIGPAIVTAACRAYMRASSMVNNDLGALATRMNALLADDLPDGRFVTMVSLLIDETSDNQQASSRIQLLSAGHGPIVLYVSTSGSVRDILPHGLPLAVMPEADFAPANHLVLAPGDVLALATDGFVEWTRTSETGLREQFGMVRLRESLARHAGLPAQQLIEAVAADVEAFAGGEPQQDDLTMVIVRRST